MAQIIPLHGDRHSETQELLPWYVNGSLDAVERAKVEAHIADCPECRAEVALERRLQGAVAELPVEAEQGWAAMRARMAVAEVRPAPPLSARASVRRALGRPATLRWVVAAQAVAAVLVVGVSFGTRQALVPQYRTLSAAPVSAAGNVIVMFRPSTSEQRIRGALLASGAHLVDGPTDADAYVLHVPGERRDAALAALRATPDVLLAQPIDAPIQ
jgi:anti-sigma factor RsiW